METILLVDDEAIVLNLCQTILRLGGYAVITAGSGTEALRLVQDNTGKIDLALLDLMMPGMNGIELAVHFKTLCPDCKVLLFSGQAATNDLLESASKSGHDFELLSKPIHPKDLLAAIRKL